MSAAQTLRQAVSELARAFDPQSLAELIRFPVILGSPAVTARATEATTDADRAAIASELMSTTIAEMKDPRLRRCATAAFGLAEFSGTSATRRRELACDVHEGLTPSVYDKLRPRAMEEIAVALSISFNPIPAPEASPGMELRPPSRDRDDASLTGNQERTIIRELEYLESEFRTLEWILAAYIFADSRRLMKLSEASSGRVRPLYRHLTASVGSLVWCLDTTISSPWAARFRYYVVPEQLERFDRMRALLAGAGPYDSPRKEYWAFAATVGDPSRKGPGAIRDHREDLFLFCIGKWWWTIEPDQRLDKAIELLEIVSASVEAISNGFSVRDHVAAANVARARRHSHQFIYETVTSSSATAGARRPYTVRSIAPVDFDRFAADWITPRSRSG